MFDFFSGLSGGLTSILPTFAGLTQGAGNLFSGFLGDSPIKKPKTPMMMPNIQQPGGNFLLDNIFLPIGNLRNVPGSSFFIPLKIE